MPRTKKTALSTAEQIALCGVILLGRDVLPVAYTMSHPRAKTTAEASIKTMLSRWYASPLAKEFRAMISAKIAQVAEHEGADLTTREGLIARLVTSVNATNGKDSISGLQTLAKIQGFDKPIDEGDDRERRMYFLPWVSNCRKCELMRLYRDLNEDDKQR